MPNTRISPYFYKAVVTDLAYDADTMDFSIQLGFKVVLEDARFRLYGIDAWEVRKNSSKGIGEDHVKKGKIARDAARSFLPPGEPSIIQTIKSKDKGKYGRYLAIVYPPIKDGMNLEGLNTLSIDSDEPEYFDLNSWLVREGHAIAKDY